MLFCGDNSSYPTYIIVLSGGCPYICDLCSKTFTDTCYLKAYQSTRRGERPCLCGVCNEASSLQVQVKRELELVIHVHRSVVSAINHLVIRLK